jgi:hypothetical protein
MENVFFLISKGDYVLTERRKKEPNQARPWLSMSKH